MAKDPTGRWERTWMHHFTRRFGHRAAFIWLVCGCWFCIGVIVGVGDPPPQDHLFHTHFPVPIRVMFWIIPAVIAATVARTEFEWMAFVVLGLPAAQRLASFWVGAGISFQTGEPPSVGWELIGRGFTYLVVLLLMWLVATWPNPLVIDFGDGFDDEGNPEDGRTVMGGGGSHDRRGIHRWQVRTSGTAAASQDSATDSRSPKPKP